MSDQDIIYEDDCEDQAITPLLKFCPSWPCCRDNKRIVVRNGQRICEGCGMSYGFINRSASGGGK
jgi:hypothetical protein